MTGPYTTPPTIPYDQSAYPPAPDVAPRTSDGAPNVAAGGRQQARTDAEKKAEQSRQQAMQAAWEAFCGYLPKPLKPQRDGADDNVMPNRCASIVAADVNFLAGLPVGVEAQPQKQPLTPIAEPDETASAGENHWQTYSDGCWGDEDDRMTLFAELVQNGSIFGHTFARILTPAQTGTEFCHLLPLDPRTIDVVTDADNHKVARCYVITYPSKDADGHSVTKRQNIEKIDPDRQEATDTDDEQEGDADATWRITCLVRRREADTTGNPDLGWEPDPQFPQPIDWPYSFPPIVDCPNMPNANEYWGQPSITPDVINLNRAIQRAESLTLRAVKLWADPKMWATGAKASQLDMTPGDILFFHSEQAKLNVLETHADIANMRAFTDDLRSDMDEQSSNPSVVFGRMKDFPRGQLSGTAMRTIHQQRMTKTYQQRRLYGSGILRDATRRFLVIGGLAKRIEDVQVILHWQDPLPQDDYQQAQSAQIWALLGVSNDTLQTNAGYDPDVERDKTDAENQRAMQQFARGQGLPPQLPGGPGVAGQGPSQPSASGPSGAGSGGPNTPGASAASAGGSQQQGGNNGAA